MLLERTNEFIESALLDRQRPIHLAASLVPRRHDSIDDESDGDWHPSSIQCSKYVGAKEGEVHCGDKEQDECPKHFARVVLSNAPLNDQKTREQHGCGHRNPIC